MRKHCIFKESCSHYVYRITKGFGLRKGVLALNERKQKCRAGYYYINKTQIRLADGSIVPNSILKEEIL